MDEWRSALARLKDIPYNNIVKKLKISYDGLDPIEKELFLDIACFFRGQHKDFAMEILDACGFHPVIGVKVLIQKALITIDTLGRFDMHDLVQEMTHYIVRGEHPTNPEKHSRIWRCEDVENICYRDATMENDKVETLYIIGYNCLPPNFLEVVANMKKLRFLLLADWNDPTLGKTPQFLSNKLRWLHWEYYPASSLPTKFQPTNLVALNLTSGFQEQLWNGYKHLPNLKVLDLSHSRNLIRTPDFNGLPCLERMILESRTNLEDIHPSIGYHERLVFLDLTGCKKLRMLPPIVGMGKLETLFLKGCNQLCKHPSKIEVGPSLIGTCCSEVISFRLKRKSPSCQHEELSFNNLVVLEFPRLLIGLDLSKCNLGDEDIPASICELSQLQILDLRRNRFSRLHFNLLQLPRLKVLDVSKCKRLVKLPELPSSIAVLLACSCDSLETLEDFPTNCKCLRIVAITVESKQCLTGSERVLHSMLQGNPIESHSFILYLPAIKMPNGFVKGNKFTLQLPYNWYNDFIGFLIFTTFKSNDGICSIDITMKQEMCFVMDRDSQSAHWNGSIDACTYSTTQVCYVPFGRLRHSAWWNSAYDKISFSFDNYAEVFDTEFVVELIPRKSKSDPNETTKATTNCSQSWDEDHKICSQFSEENYEDDSTFWIKHDSKSSLTIRW